MLQQTPQIWAPLKLARDLDLWGVMARGREVRTSTLDTRSAHSTGVPAQCGLQGFPPVMEIWCQWLSAGCCLSRRRRAAQVPDGDLSCLCVAGACPWPCFAPQTVSRHVHGAAALRRMVGSPGRRLAQSAATLGPSVPSLFYPTPCAQPPTPACLGRALPRFSTPAWRPTHALVVCVVSWCTDITCYRVALRAGCGWCMVPGIAEVGLCQPAGGLAVGCHVPGRGGG
jgi:hypothetical protein